MGAKCSIICDDSGKKKIGYKFFELVGTGGFSKVWKVQKDGEMTYRALKQMVKFRIMSKNSVQAILNERLILENLDHPFIVNLYSSFQDKYNLYLIMDYLPGGDLRYHIKVNKTFSESNAKFIIGSALIALEYVHSKNIIHRDIKPENLVFDAFGYLRLTDFGISRFLKTDNSNETSGTPGYLAPETLMRLNHGKESDYFGIGVILFEIIKGYRPYNVRTRKEMRDQIFNKEVQINPDEKSELLSEACIDIINKLIKIKPFKRLGFNGIEEIFNHPWFEGFDWESLRNKQFKDIQFIPKEGMNYNRKPRVETQTCEEDLKNKDLLNKNEYQLLFKDYDYKIPIKEEATNNNYNAISSNDQGPQCSLSQYNQLEDQS